MKRCIQDGDCQKIIENEKSAKIEVYHCKTKTNNYSYCRTAKKPKQKKIYNKGKIIENEEKQDKIGRKEQIIYG